MVTSASPASLPPSFPVKATTEIPKALAATAALTTFPLLPEVEIPDKYLHKEPDNTKIREALKKGAELPFAVLKERGDHLVIR